MAQCERKIIDPLEVVHEQDDRLDRTKGAMSGLEDAHGLQGGSALGVEHELAEPAPDLRKVGEPPEQIGGRRERRPLFRLVADDAKAPGADEIGGLGEQTSLAAPWISDDHHGRGAAVATPASVFSSSVLPTKADTMRAA